jgi:hypothetical protein
MTNSQLRYRNISIACVLLAVAIGQRTAQAGPVYIYLLIDPRSTAGAGVPTSNGMRVTSSKSGPGTFQLYAVDDIPGSFGIKSYNVKLNGTITTFLNRAPNATWDDADFSDTFPEGFNELRTAVAATGTTSAGQGPTNPVFIEGFGISGGDFVAANPLAAPGFTFQSSSGQWGNYSLSNFPFDSSNNISGRPRYALFLAEGNYIGASPTVNLTTPAGQGGTSVNYFTRHGSSAAATATSYSSQDPFFTGLDPEPASVTLVALAFFGLIGFVRHRVIA